MIQKIFLSAAALIIAVVTGLYLYRPGMETRPFISPLAVPVDGRNATYIIEGDEYALSNGVSEKSADDSALKITTQYFGNEVLADLDGDGIGDAAFILTQDGGGTGTFFYVAAALNSEKGAQGTNAILLGDRIAPQTTEFRNGMIIVNYADRNPGEPFTTQPSLGVSRYFKVIDGALVEIPLAMGEADAKTIAGQSCVKGGEVLGEGSYNENSKTWWFDANLNSVREGCNPACVVSAETKTAEINWRCTGLRK